MDNKDLISEWLVDALRKLDDVLEKLPSTSVKHLDAVRHGIVEAEKNIAHVIGLIVEKAP